MKGKIIAIGVLTTIALVITVAYGIFVLGTADYMRSNDNYIWAGVFEYANLCTITLAWSIFTEKVLEFLEEDEF